MNRDNTSETKILMEQDPQTMANPEKLSELRIVLFGRTGVGKSTLGDIIMGNNTFTSKDIDADTDRLTEKCHKETSTIEGRNVVVVDTPGLFKRKKRPEDIVSEIKRSVGLAKPGPHVFLLVEILKPIADDELKTLEVFESTFGKHAMAYTMVVFTHENDKKADKAKTEKVMKKYKLKNLLEPCHGRHFFFNIKNGSPAQVTELLNIIRQTGKEYYYTPEMLEEAEKKRSEEQQGNNPKPAGTENKTAFFETSGWIGILVGCGLGYFIGGGELDSKSGALVGAGAGMILSLGTTALGMMARRLFKNCSKTGDLEHRQGA